MKTIIIFTLALALMVPLSLVADTDNWGGPGTCGAEPRMMGAGGHHGMGMHGGAMGKHRGTDMQPGRGMGFRSKTPGIAALLRHADDLGLSEKQVSDLERLRSEFQLAQVDRKASMEKARIRMRDLMQDDGASESTVFSQIDEISRLQAEAKKVHYSHMKAVKAVLSDEQIEKLKSFREDRREEMFEERIERRMERRGAGRGLNQSN